MSARTMRLDNAESMMSNALEAYALIPPPKGEGGARSAPGGVDSLNAKHPTRLALSREPPSPLRGEGWEYAARAFGLRCQNVDLSFR